MLAQAVAIFPWTARKDSHLSFEKGAIITLRKQGDSWWAGELNGKVGWFPKSYVKVIRASRRGPGSQGSFETASEAGGDESGAALGTSSKEAYAYVAMYQPCRGKKKGERKIKKK